MSMYSDDPRLQPCTNKLAATKEDCASCIFIDQCLHDTLDYEALTGEQRAGTFGGLTQSERVQRAG